MLTILLLLAIAGYVISAVVILRNLLQNRELHSGFHIIPALVAIISHALLVFNEFSADNFHHINIASSLASVSWLVALFALLRSHHSGSLLLKPVVYLFAALTCLLLALAPAQWGSYINMNAGCWFILCCHWLLMAYCPGYSVCDSGRLRQLHVKTTSQPDVVP